MMPLGMVKQMWVDADSVGATSHASVYRYVCDERGEDMQMPTPGHSLHDHKPPCSPKDEIQGRSYIQVHFGSNPFL